MSGKKDKRSGWVMPIAVLALLLVLVYFWHHRHMTEAPEKSKAAEVANRSTRMAQGAQGAASPASPQTSQSPVPVFPVQADGTVAIPAHFQLPGVARAKSGASSQEWLAQFPPEQREKILAFGRKHFGVYSVNSPQQVAWMAENGYPLPEDVIAAESLSDADLRALMEQGNDKAGFLLRERNLDTIRTKLEAYHAQGKSTSDFWSNDPDARQLSQDDLKTTELLQRSHSPFKGYLQAKSALLENEQLGVESGVIAGLLWAESLGDFRASQFLNEYIYKDNSAIREAMFTVASAVSTNATTDSIWMKSNGCENAGVPPGMYIPGNFAPVK